MHPAQPTIQTGQGQAHATDPAPGFALLIHTVRMQTRGVLIWGIALGGLGLMMTSIFPSIGAEGDIEGIFNSYPAALRDLVGVEDGTNLSTIGGWLSAEMYGLLVPLAAAFFPILAGAAAIAGAEERGTLDVLLSNPLPRWQLVAARFVGTAISLLGMLLILGALTWFPVPFIDVDLSAVRSLEGALNV